MDELVIESDLMIFMIIRMSFRCSRYQKKKEGCVRNVGK